MARLHGMGHLVWGERCPREFEHSHLTFPRDICEARPYQLSSTEEFCESRRLLPAAAAERPDTELVIRGGRHRLQNDDLLAKKIDEHP